MEGTTDVRPGPIRIHLGCGEVYLPGYLNVDYPGDEHTVQTSTNADLRVDLRTLTYPIETASEVRLHHVFEHFPRGSALGLLIRWYGWLIEDGTLIIETPDFERTARSFRRAITRHQRGVALRHLFGSHEAAWAIHRDGWYRTKFDRTLTTLGFRELEFERSTWRGTSNITVRARKTRPFAERNAQINAATQLLRESLIDESPGERRLLEVWLDDLRQTAEAAPGDATHAKS